MSTASTSGLCECAAWCRADILSPYGLRNAEGVPLVTNHHPRCPHYNDSMTDVYVVEAAGGRYFTLDLHDAKEKQVAAMEAALPGIRFGRMRMHREIYDNMVEFGGF